ncbi:MAG: translation factor Sua5 [Spirochaetales bacterium]|nr:MAG: translation factor Sua5 [Spirochaetales bacterium]
MIEYIVPGNIDHRILQRAAEHLKSGRLVAHPTDTSWHISCAASSANGIEALKKLKAGAKAYLFTLLADDISQASSIAEISTSQYKIIHRLAPGPYVFVLTARRKLEKLTGMKRREVGIRLPSDPVSRALIHTLQEPLFSITAARSMDNQNLWTAEFAEENLFEMGWELEDIPALACILDSGDPLDKHLTTVLNLTGGEFTTIRQGVGPSPF